MASCRIAVLGSKIQYLAAEVDYARANNNTNPDAQDELQDALEDLQLEISEPMHWPGSFLAPPDFSVMQVAFQYRIFEHIPLPASGKSNTNSLPSGVIGSTKTETPSINAQNLAASVGMDEGILVRIMRLLIINQIFREVEEKTFAHSALSVKMTEERVNAHLSGLTNDIYKACPSLTDAIRGGQQSAFMARFGMPMYEYFEKNNSADRVHLMKSMAMAAMDQIKDVATMYPWARLNKVVEMGGGAGHLATYLTEQFPHLQAINQDLPQVITDARKSSSTHPRLEHQIHSYYDRQPLSNADVDAYIIRRCLHNTADEECVRIMKAIVSGLEQHHGGGKLLIIEHLMPKWDAYSTRRKTKNLRREDIVMMISVGGRERTVEEFRALLKQADERFEIVNIFNGQDHYGVLECKLSAS